MALRVKNIQYGTTTKTGEFHPWRGSPDYDPTRLHGKEGQRARAKVRARRKKRTTGKRKPVARKHARRTAKAPARRKNPISTKWVTARVRRLGHDVQVMLFPKGKVAKAQAKRRVARRRR